jgi:hypothetical protein
MDLAEVVRIIRARWYVMVPLLVVTILLTVGLDRSIPTKYQTTSSVSLLASQSATQGTANLPGTKNPFLNYSSSLNDTADFLVRRLGSTDAANDLGQRGVTESYAVVLAAGAQGPFITLTVTGTNPKHVLSSMNTLTQYTVEQLEAVQVQASVRPEDMIRSMQIVPPGPPTKQTKTKTQDVLLAGFGGLVISFLATFMVESILTSRRRRRRRVPFGADAARREDDYEDKDYEEPDYEADPEPVEGAHANGAESGYGEGNANGSGKPSSAAPVASRWYGMDGGADLERDPFEPAHPELSGRAPGSRD